MLEESDGSGSVSGTGLVEAGRKFAWVAVYTESAAAAVGVPGVSSAVGTVSGVCSAADVEVSLGQESWTGVEALFGAEPSTEDELVSGFWTGAEDVSGLGSLAAVMFAPSS